MMTIDLSMSINVSIDPPAETAKMSETIKYATVFLVAFVLSARGMCDLELPVPLCTPLLTGIDAQIVVASSTVRVGASLGFNEAGKVVGAGSIDGAAVVGSGTPDLLT